MNPKETKVSLKKNITLKISAPKKITTNNILMNKILAYSAKKIKANPPLLYSTLNPETSSDSPSAKSKGVRLVSANLEANQTNLKGNDMTIIQE
jgi:hypothetical protein